jgi:hypothetical protein
VQVRLHVQASVDYSPGQSDHVPVWLRQLDVGVWRRCWWWRLAASAVVLRRPGLTTIAPVSKVGLLRLIRAGGGSGLRLY